QSIKKTLSSECSVTHKKASSKRGNYLPELALILLLFNLFTNSIHVQIANLLDQVLESRWRQRTSLVEYLDAIAEHHQGRNRLNLQSTSYRLGLFSITLRESDILMLVRSLVQDRRKTLTWSAPVSPGVNNRNAFADGGFFKIFLGNFYGCHTYLL